MRKLRTGAIIIGIFFGCFNLLSFIGETYEHRDHALNDMGISDVILWIAGPLTLILATLFGFRHERFAGYSLITGAAITTAILTLRLSPASLFLAFLMLVLPMLVEGWLWLNHATLPASSSDGRS